jgi:hypothetical protein
MRADADDANRRVHGRQERRIGVGRAVMRHFQDVRAQIFPRPEQPVLFLHLGIAAEHDPHAIDGRAQHER